MKFLTHRRSVMALLAMIILSTVHTSLGASQVRKNLEDTLKLDTVIAIHHPSIHPSIHPSCVILIIRFDSFIICIAHKRYE